VAYAACLVPVSLVPTFVGVSGSIYFWIALLLGAALLALSIRFARSRNERSARALFFGSIVYLPLIWAAMILNHR
jgi:protoheme IX farnesyltransferase